MADSSGQDVDMTTERAAFPQDQNLFVEDPRISFSNIDKKWMLKDYDGAEWEWSPDVSRWVPSVDEEMLKQQQSIYGPVKDDEENQDEQPNASRKRKNGNSSSQAKKKNKGENKKAARPNSAIYVTGLPTDATLEEIKDVFSKCGLIAESIDGNGAPRIKMYTDEDGDFKGDALIVYFRPESVSLAIQLLDDTEFRPSNNGRPGDCLHVMEANSSYKRHKGGAEDNENDEAKDAQEGKKPAKPKLTKDQQHAIKRTQSQMSKLMDWSDDDPQDLGEQKTNKFEKVVILKHMFTMAELEADKEAIVDIKEDITGECEKFGEITNTVVYDLEKDGVVTVKFREAEAARACIEALNGRMFAGMTVEAYISSTKEQFKKSIAVNAEDQESRLNEFNESLDQA